MNLFNQIYDLTFLPLITPTSLLDNLNLENYLSINFVKKEKSLIAEVTCIVNDKNVIFNYEFDKENYLNYIYFYENNEREFLFNRDDLLKTLRNEYSDSLNLNCI